MYKIIGVDQKEYGPITADQIRLWISEGRINAATKVQVIGEADWKFVGQLPEFASLLPRSAPPLGISPISIAPVQKTSQMAVWSLITGIFSLLCCQILAPVSIVLGAVAISHIKNNPQQRGHGLAVGGIVLGVIALLIAITVIVLVIAYPAMWQNFQNALPSPP